jgi:hypothetical protein
MPQEPLPFLQAMFKAIGGPNTANFHRLAQNPNANATQGFLWIAIASAIGTLISTVLFTFIPNAANQYSQMLEYFRQYGNIEIPDVLAPTPSILGIGLRLICGIPLGVILAVVGAAIVAGLIHLVAGLLGGHGEYGKMVYMLALIQVPLGLVSTILTPLWFLGCLSALFGLYALVLEVLAIDGVYQFGTGKAVLTLLIPLVVLCLVIACIVVGIASFLGIVARETFENLPQDFPLP